MSGIILAYSILRDIGVIRGVAGCVCC